MLHGNDEIIMIDDQKVVYETAIEMADKSKDDDKKRVLIVEGGPGTGKSVLAINLLAEIINLDMVTLYVTKNSAPRNVFFEKLKGEDFSKTYIKNLFKSSGSFTQTEENQFDVLIVDETSMVDIHLFYHLLKALRPGTKLILSGDSNQLPSVGPGNVLRDIIDSGVFKVTELTTIYRQEANSRIVTYAHDVNNGIKPQFANDTDDFFMLKRDTKESLYTDMVRLVRDKLPKRFETDMYNHARQPFCFQKNKPKYW
jgi:ATP-dependent exoDNAse (exonuclease V) alpha subunit